MAEADIALQFVLKVVSRCNLNCSYCYVYNKGDTTWQTRPKIMSDKIFIAALHRIRRHCLASGQTSVRIIFHGGEPTLAGVMRFSTWCHLIDKTLHDFAQVQICLQTNATLLDDQWAKVLREYKVDVGISMDGPKEMHDAFRVDHQGRGSYDAVEQGIRVLREANIPIQILSVIQFGADPLKIHRHLIGFGATAINYLLPDFTHDTIGPIRELYGPTPCADYLIPIFDDWWFNGTLEVKVAIFWNIARLILGGNSEIDLLGNGPLQFVFVEADGAIEGLDVLRVCQQGLAKTGLNALTDDFVRIAEVSDLHKAVIFDGMALPSGCRLCSERNTCAGGYLPHRYSHRRAFDNPTVWCQDMLRLFAHIRERMGVSIEETELRRQLLRDFALESA